MLNGVVVQARVLLFVAAAVALAGGIVWAALPRDASPVAAVGARAGRGGPAAPAAPDGTRAGLEQALRDERRAREALASEVATLRAAIEALGGALPPAEETPPSPPAGAEGPEAERAAEPDALLAGTEPEPAAAAAAIPYFDVESLARYGLADWEVERLRDQYEAAQMRKLNVSARAQREGWNGRRRHTNALERIDTQLREEIGEPRYDLALWAAGHPNRLRVLRVLHSSPAEQAGIRAGDLIRSYGGRTVYSTRELRSRTQQTGGDRNVPIEVVSGVDASPDRIFVPGGAPLGVVLEPVLVQPNG